MHLSRALELIIYPSFSCSLMEFLFFLRFLLGRHCGNEFLLSFHAWFIFFIQFLIFKDIKSLRLSLLKIRRMVLLNAYLTFSQNMKFASFSYFENFWREIRLTFSSDSVVETLKADSFWFLKKFTLSQFRFSLMQIGMQSLEHSSQLEIAAK